MGVFSCLISYYFSGPRIIDFLFIGLPVAKPQGHAQSRNEKQLSILTRKKAKWRADLPVGIACPSPPEVEPILEGRGGDGPFRIKGIQSLMLTPKNVETKLIA